MSKVGDTKNQPVNQPKNHDPKAYVKAWRGPSGKIFPIDLAWLANIGDILEQITAIHKAKIKIIHHSMSELCKAIYGQPIRNINKYGSLFKRTFFHFNPPSPDRFSEGFAKGFHPDEASLEEFIDEKCEQEWNMQQYSLQRGAWYVYGGSIMNAMSGVWPQGRPV